MGKFLNIRVYNNPLNNKPFTTVLRKARNKYNIIPPNSNTHRRYKKMAGLSYYNTAKMHSGSIKELETSTELFKQFLNAKDLVINKSSK